MKNQQAAGVLREISPARIFARPTADDLWLGPTQESALRHLATRVPVRSLLGPLSSGRTTLLCRLALVTKDQCAYLRIPGPQRFRASVLKRLLQSAGLQADGLERDEMRQLIDVFIRERLARGQRIVVEVDDADAYGPAAWSEIERLRAGWSPTEGPELVLSLVHIDEASSPAADFVRAQAAPALIVLSWMSPTAVSWYMDWRLNRFGLTGIATAAATRLIARCSRGCFASVDHICQMALLLLRNRQGEQIDVMIVREAIRALQRQRQQNSGSEEPPAAELIVTRDGAVLHQVSVGDRLLVGRSPRNDLCLENSYLSRHHLAIMRGESGFYLSDLNSSNGVFLNGQRVHAAPVGDGDVLHLGPYKLKLSMSQQMLGRRLGPDEPELLADTVVMPAPKNPKPAHLKVIK